MYNEERQKQADICFKKGNYQQIGKHICQNGTPLNFIASGRITNIQFDVLEPMLEAVMGKYPLIIIHNNHSALEDKVRDIYNRTGGYPMWNIKQNNMIFEPFYGMDDTKIVKILKRLAELMNYSVTPRFERIVRAHLRILKEQNIPSSLAKLYYLCQFEDMQELQNNIMALSCGGDISRKIWADFGLDNERNAEQFDLFRNVIMNFAYEMQQSGWKSNGDNTRVNAMTAIRQNATMVYSLNDSYTEFFFNYLVDELKGNEGKPFFLLLDNVRLDDEYIANFLTHPTMNCRYGIVGENVPALISGNQEKFLQLAEKIHCYILFKHKTFGAATVFSDIMGKFDYTKTEYSEGSQRESFKIMASGHHTDTRYSIENQYRIMPEDIMHLSSGQAYVFDALTDTIHKYN